MKPQLHSLSVGAGTAALLILAACQQADQGVGAPETPSLDATGPAPAIHNGDALAGRPATAEEIARFLAERKDGAVSLPQSAPAPLAKAAAVPGPTCNVDFNSSSSLSYMSDQAWTTFAYWPYYIHNCSSGWMYSNPVGTNHFHLAFAHTNWCNGSPYKVGYRQTNGSCTSQFDAKLFPRTALNMGAGTAIQFYAQNSSQVRKNFDLKSILVVNTTPIYLLAYRTDVGWWQWSPLTQGTWTFSNANNLSEMTIYANDRLSTYEVDKITVNVHY